MKYYIYLTNACEQGAKKWLITKANDDTFQAKEVDSVHMLTPSWTEYIEAQNRYVVACEGGLEIYDGAAMIWPHLGDDTLP